MTTKARVIASNKLTVKPGGVAPAVYLLHVSDSNWEQFIEAACRNHEIHGKKYIQVNRLGNANDKGRDVEARLSEKLAADCWDLYQAKHYANRLTPGDAYPEMSKFFGHLLAGSYPTPRKYYFCAPRNAGPELHDLLADPENLKKKFVAAWKAGSHGLSTDTFSEEIAAFVDAYDFSRFEECLVHDLLAWHSIDSKKHFELFGIEPERGSDPDVPPQALPTEATYIGELLKAYSEHSGKPISIQEALASPDLEEHLAAARGAFYSAEGLKRFSRDIFPDDEFGKLLDMVKVGIRLVIHSPRLKTGLERHDAAIYAASNLSVTDSALHPRLRGGDLPGSCHHLVNDNKLKWVK